MSKLWEIEDELQARDVFVNGIDGRICHSDAYMTVLDYNALDKAWPEIFPMFTIKDWEDACEELIYFGYLSPVLKLTGLTIKRKLKSA